MTLSGCHYEESNEILTLACELSHIIKLTELNLEYCRMAMHGFAIFQLPKQQSWSRLASLVTVTVYIEIRKR